MNLTTKMLQNAAKTVQNAAKMIQKRKSYNNLKICERLYVKSNVNTINLKTDTYNINDIYNNLTQQFTQSDLNFILHIRTLYTSFFVVVYIGFTTQHLEKTQTQ